MIFGRSCLISLTQGLGLKKKSVLWFITGCYRNGLINSSTAIYDCWRQDPMVQVGSKCINSGWQIINIQIMAQCTV